MANQYKNLEHTAAQIDGTVDGFSSHAADEISHVTSLDRERWDGKANADLSNVTLDSAPESGGESPITSGGVYSAITKTEYITPELHSNASGKVEIESGGYVTVGNFCILNCRIRTTAQLTGSGIFANLPTPISASTLGAGSGVVAVTNHKGYTMTVTNGRHLTIAAANLPVDSGTVIIMSCIYPCIAETPTSE